VLSSAEYEIQTALQYTAKVAESCEKYGDLELAAEINEKLEAHYADYLVKLQPQRQLQQLNN